MIIVGSKQFTSQKALTVYIQNLLRTIGVGRVSKTEHYEFLIELVRRHPDAEKRLLRMTDIVIRRNRLSPDNNEISILSEDGTEEALSYRHCITERKKTSNVMYTKSLRTVIIAQIVEYRRTCNMTCSICGSQEEIEIDHELHFSDIRDEFTKRYKIEIPTEYDRNDADLVIFKPMDKYIGDMFCKFHKERAKLRPLCKSCNRETS